MEQSGSTVQCSPVHSCALVCADQSTTDTHSNPIRERLVKHSHKVLISHTHTLSPKNCQKLHLAVSFRRTRLFSVTLPPNDIHTHNVGRARVVRDLDSRTPLSKTAGRHVFNQLFCQPPKRYITSGMQFSIYDTSFNHLFINFTYS